MWNEGRGFWILFPKQVNCIRGHSFMPLESSKTGLGPKIGPLIFFKKIVKNSTPHIFGHILLNFCPKVKCHTILESWDVGLSDYARKKFKIYCPMRNKHLKIGYPRCHNLGVRTPIKKILSQKSLFFEYIYGSQKNFLNGHKTAVSATN